MRNHNEEIEISTQEEQVNKKYQIIYADPPWQFSNKKTDGSMKSGAANQYLTTGIEGLKSLDVNSIADDDCVLFMWYVGGGFTVWASFLLYN